MDIEILQVVCTKFCTKINMSRILHNVLNNHIFIQTITVEHIRINQWIYESNKKLTQHFRI